jgi:osmoprotectant transport system permease protein
VIAFMQSHWWEIGRLTFEHLWLTLSAMLLAVAIGLPVGIWLSRHRRFAGPVIGFANVVQTVPSLALVGLLLPVPWLG